MFLKIPSIIKETGKKVGKSLIEQRVNMSSHRGVVKDTLFLSLIIREIHFQVWFYKLKGNYQYKF